MKLLSAVGERGNRARLYRATGEKPFVVQGGTKRRQARFSTRSEAERYIMGRGWERAPLTNRALWERYRVEEERGLSPSTLVSYEQAWRRWEKFAGAEQLAGETTAEQIYGFPRSLEKSLSAATVRTALSAIRSVFGWAKRLELIEENKWRDYRHRTSAARRTKQRGEYREDDIAKIGGALDPTLDTQWRPWVEVHLLAIYGARPSEILQMRWSWVTETEIVIPAYAVKTREERRLPLVPEARAVLAIAGQWRIDDDPDAFVLSGRNGKHYQLRDFNRDLRAAEDRAGVPHIRLRSGHAFRRGAVGDWSDATGDVALALLAVGDKNLAQAKNYRVRRDDKTTAPITLRAARIIDVKVLAALSAKIGNEHATSDDEPVADPVPTPSTEAT